MYDLPVRNTDGSVLLTFDPLREEDLGTLNPSVPLTAALVVLWWDEKCLMVFNRFHQAWELPGGMIDPGESAREAAVRELDEESGQRADSLELAGVTKIQVAPDNRLEFLAVYRGYVDTPRSFAPNDEMSEAVWWTPGEPLADLFPIDAALAMLAQWSGEINGRTCHRDLRVRRRPRGLRLRTDGSPGSHRVRR